MNEQLGILIILLIATGVTIAQYCWKAKKEITYKKDERWQMIQVKANTAANFVNIALVVSIAVGLVFSVFFKAQPMFSLNRVLVIGLVFIGLRNSIEFISLLVYDRII